MRLFLTVRIKSKITQTGRFCGHFPAPPPSIQLSRKHEITFVLTYRLESLVSTIGTRFPVGK